MKSSSEILMDFKKSVRYAEKLDRLAKGLREETGYYETLSFWEGEAASVWSGKTLALEKEIETGQKNWNMRQIRSAGLRNESMTRKCMHTIWRENEDIMSSRRNRRWL